MNENNIINVKMGDPKTEVLKAKGKKVALTPEEIIKNLM